MRPFHIKKMSGVFSRGAAIFRTLLQCSKNKMRPFTGCLFLRALQSKARRLRCGSATMNHISLDTLTLTTFLPLVKTAFRARTNDSAFVEIQLTHALPPRHARPDVSDHKSFSLLFSGPGDRFLAQGIYSFEHDAIGQFDLFIVPIGRNDGRFEYQAVFNRLEPEA
jgi:hypothetical protein